jgi:dihydrofolate reductase
MASAMQASDLLQHGLIDEYRVILNPVFIGPGTPLFKGIKRGLKLTLRRTKQLRSDLAILHYGKE